MDKRQHLNRLADMAKAMQQRSGQLIEQARGDGSLKYYYDSNKCNNDEVIRLFDGKEQIITKETAIKVNE